MFTYSIDSKPTITDKNGNLIVDLTRSIFAKSSGLVRDYDVIKINEHYVMRPDLVSRAVYDTDLRAEFILKFSGVSNPFTLAEDDVLMIPNATEAEGTMSVNNPDSDGSDMETTIAQIRNYYKFVNQEYQSDSKSYDDLKNRYIPSGIIDTTNQNDYIVPYISEDGRTAVTIRGGKMYFGEDAGITTANNANVTAGDVTKSVQSIIDDAITSLSDSNCIYNGASIADFVRSNMTNNS